MNPRLDESAPLTQEDFDIYVTMAGHFRKHGYRVLKAYDDADRRDAELMLTIAMNRHLGTDCEDGDEQFSLSAWVLDMAVEE